MNEVFNNFFIVVLFVGSSFAFGMFLSYITRVIIKIVNELFPLGVIEVSKKTATHWIKHRLGEYPYHKLVDDLICEVSSKFKKWGSFKTYPNTMKLKVMRFKNPF